MPGSISRDEGGDARLSRVSAVDRLHVTVLQVAVLWRETVADSLMLHDLLAALSFDRHLSV